MASESFSKDCSAIFSVSFTDIPRSLRDTFVLALLGLLLLPCSTFANDAKTSVRIALRSEAVLEGNLIRLSDLADLSGIESTIRPLQEVVLGPAPREGKTQKISKQEIQSHLGRHGFLPESFRWAGAEVCNVKRGLKSSRTRDDYVSLTATPVTLVQAQRNVEQAILAYLQLQSNSTTQWKVQATVPKEYSKILGQKRAITGIAGGKAPWEGPQDFTLLLQTSTGEQELAIRALIEAPPQVLAATGPLRQGQVITQKDLQFVSLTSSARVELEDCCLDPTEAIGKEIRKAISSGQPISKKDLGPPRVINSGDLIEVEVITGSVSVQTTGRSLQAGGIGDAIQIEVLPHKKKLMAHIVADRKVQVGANYGR